MQFSESLVTPIHSEKPKKTFPSLLANPCQRGTESQSSELEPEIEEKEVSLLKKGTKKASERDMTFSFKLSFLVNASAWNSID